MTVMILMAFALVLLILAAANMGHPRVSMGWAGMSCWALAYLIAAVGAPVP